MSRTPTRDRWSHEDLLESSEDEAPDPPADDHDPSTVASRRERLARRRNHPSSHATARDLAEEGRQRERDQISREAFERHGRTGSHEDLRVAAGEADRRTRFKRHGRIESEEDLRDVARQHEEQRRLRAEFEQRMLVRDPNWGSHNAADLAFEPHTGGPRAYVPPPPLYATTGRMVGVSEGDAPPYPISHEEPALPAPARATARRDSTTSPRADDPHRGGATQHSLARRSRRTDRTAFEPVARW
ncbi:hypothetical protein JCM10450v2_002414 [Rhodotorula kratochvilovae]